MANLGQQAAGHGYLEVLYDALDPDGQSQLKNWCGIQQGTADALGMALSDWLAMIFEPLHATIAAAEEAVAAGAPAAPIEAERPPASRVTLEPAPPALENYKQIAKAPRGLPAGVGAATPKFENKVGGDFAKLLAQARTRR